MTVQALAAMVRGNDPFTFARYGNGEWDAILGKGTRTGSGSQDFTSELRAQLARTVIEHDDKILGMQSERYLRKLGLWTPVLDWLEVCAPDAVWAPGDVLHWASRDGQLYQFIDVMRDVRPILVGPEWLSRLDFDHLLFKIPSINCWFVVDEITKRLVKFPAGQVICLSAGPAAKVIAHRLHGLGHRIIDCGSLWDVYCWRPSRKYHHAMTPQIIEANLYGQ